MTTNGIGEDSTHAEDSTRKSEHDVLQVLFLQSQTYYGADSQLHGLLMRDLGLTVQVIFTGFRSDVANILAASDIYAMPSFEEPFGMVYLEAMAMKKPVIALDNGSTREVVEQNVTGLLSPPYDSDALAQNILTLLDNRELREQMGTQGRVRAERQFSPQQMADNVERVYRSIVHAQA